MHDIGVKNCRIDSSHLVVLMGASPCSRLFKSSSGSDFLYLVAKQYIRPSPPDSFRSSCPQPRVACAEFQGDTPGVLASRSWWPIWAFPGTVVELPAVQFRQVMSSPAG